MLPPPSQVQRLFFVFARANVTGSSSPWVRGSKGTPAHRMTASHWLPSSRQAASKVSFQPPYGGRAGRMTDTHSSSKICWNFRD